MLINENGFNATTVRDIAEDIGLQVANFYNYIESNDQMLEGHLRHVQEEFNGYIDLVLEPTCTPDHKLRLVITQHVRFALQYPYELSLMENP